MTPARVVVVGLDCLAPQLVFERWRDRLPTLSALMDEGTWGPLRSTDPPITVPAWTAMFSGRDPGELGLYGFKHRRSRAYDDVGLPGPPDVPRLWDYAGDAGLDSLVVGVPQTWPPPPIRGHLVSGFLAPGTDVPYTHPPQLADEIARLAPGYRLDVDDFRDGDTDRIHDDIRRMTDARFSLFTRWLTTKPWQLAIVVEIGVDRMHHALWGAGMDRILAYYEDLDAKLGTICDLVGDETTVMVVSDHGAQSMVGAVCLNEWLIERGLLVVELPPGDRPVPLADCKVRWSQTRAWADGGYCGRIYLNVRGREPQGIIPPDRYEAERDALAAALRELPGPAGEPLDTTVLYPGTIYRETRGFPPDLIVYFDALRRRALGTVGSGEIHAEANDTGHDGANHALDGVFVLRAPDVEPQGRVEGLVLYDVFATVMARLALRSPATTLGTDRGRAAPCLVP